MVFIVESIVVDFVFCLILRLVRVSELVLLVLIIVVDGVVIVDVGCGVDYIGICSVVLWCG